MPFQKGQSGNPGGRPKALAEIQDAARAHSIAAVETLARIASDTSAPPAAQVAAANAILDRGWGRPTVSVDARIGVMSLEQLVMATYAKPAIEDSGEE
jgi:hypothetical protein